MTDNIKECFNGCVANDPNFAITGDIITGPSAVKEGPDTQPDPEANPIVGDVTIRGSELPQTETTTHGQPVVKPPGSI